MKSYQQPPPTTEENTEGSFGGLPDLAWGNSDILASFFPDQETNPFTVLGRLLGGADPWGGAEEEFGGGEEAQGGVDEEVVVPEPAPEAVVPPPDVIHDDGFNETKAQREMDEMLEQYQTLEVDGVEGEVDAGYKIGEFKDTGDVVHKDPREEFISYRSDQDMYEPGTTKSVPSAELRAITGKATPEELEQAFATAIDEGTIHEDLGREPGTALTPEDLEEWADERIGVDCSGFVKNLINSNSQLESLGDKVESGTAIVKACDDDKDTKADLEESPENWRAMDVIRWGGSGPNGHILVVYSVEKNKEGGYDVTVMHSHPDTEGPKKETIKLKADGTPIGTKIVGQDYEIARPDVGPEVKPPEGSEPYVPAPRIV